FSSPRIHCQVIAVTTGNKTLTGDNQKEPVPKFNIIDWEPPVWVKTKFPYFHSGYDYDDKPVIVLQWGKWNTLPIVSKGGEDLQILNNYCDQFFARIQNGTYGKNHSNPKSNLEKTVDQTVLIIDLDGLNGDQLSSRSNVLYQIQFNGKMNKVRDYIAYGFQINVNPFGLFLLNAAKQSTSSLIDIMEIHGTNSAKWKPALLRKIPFNQLPPQYGGRKYLPKMPKLR
ncbi:unnamed protein product, partial [Allacma fusca]